MDQFLFDPFVTHPLAHFQSSDLHAHVPACASCDKETERSAGRFFDSTTVMAELKQGSTGNDNRSITGAVSTGEQLHFLVREVVRALATKVVAPVLAARLQKDGFAHPDGSAITAQCLVDVIMNPLHPGTMPHQQHAQPRVVTPPASDDTDDWASFDVLDDRLPALSTVYNPRVQDQAGIHVHHAAAEEEPEENQPAALSDGDDDDQPGEQCWGLVVYAKY